MESPKTQNTINHSQLPNNTQLAIRALIPRKSIVNGQFLAAEPWSISGFSFDQNQLDRYRSFFQFPDQFVPISFLFVATQQAQLSYLSQSSVKVKLLGLVHGSIEFDQQALIADNQEYRLQISLGEQIWTDKGLQFDLVVDLFSGTQRKAGFVSRYIQFTHSNSSIRPRKASLTNEAPIWTPVNSTVVFPKNIGRRYASISKDYNPIHLSPLFSRLFGFRKPIVHGMYSAAIILSAQTLGTPSRVCIRFRKPILMPNTATLAQSGSRWALLLDEDRIAVDVTIDV